MGYGIRIENGSGFISIESDDTGVEYPNVFLESSSEQFLAEGQPLPTGGLIFARPPTPGPSTVNLIGYNAKDNQVWGDGSPRGIYYRVVKPTTAGGFTPGTGYGINVFNSSGQCTFSATSNNYSSNFEIIATYITQNGIGDTGFQFNISVPEYAIGNERTYVLLNSSCTTITGNGLAEGIQQTYSFNSDGFGYIRYTSGILSNPSGDEWHADLIGNGNAIVIGYVRG